MKKSFVFLLLGLAVIVMVSPGIVGRLAERSMDENIDWAADESQELVVTSQAFDRGWFSSEGQHRIELRDGELRNLLVAVAGLDNDVNLPALIIDTRLDHGLIPVASMSRDKGSLMPGLGKAVSTLSLETGDGERVMLPGTIYSDIGLGGALSSNYLLPAGSRIADGEEISWSDIDINVTAEASSGDIAFAGSIDSFSGGGLELLEVKGLRFDGSQRPTSYGLPLFDLDMTLDSVSLTSPGGADFGALVDASATSIGPLRINSTSTERRGRVSQTLDFSADNLPIGLFDSASVNLKLNLKDVDGPAFGQLMDALDGPGVAGTPGSGNSAVQASGLQLMASGFELQLEPLEINTPQGTMTVTLDVDVDETDSDNPVWTQFMLATDANAQLSIPKDLMAMITAMEPNVNAVIGMGYLRLNGDAYEMNAAFENGQLTVNDAPVPIPLGSFR